MVTASHCHSWTADKQNSDQYMFHFASLNFCPRLVLERGKAHAKVLLPKTNQHLLLPILLAPGRCRVLIYQGGVDPAGIQASRFTYSISSKREVGDAGRIPHEPSGGQERHGGPLADPLQDLRRYCAQPDQSTIVPKCWDTDSVAQECLRAESQSLKYEDRGVARHQLDQSVLLCHHLPLTTQLNGSVEIK